MCRVSSVFIYQQERDDTESSVILFSLLLAIHIVIINKSAGSFITRFCKLKHIDQDSWESRTLSPGASN